MKVTIIGSGNVAQHLMRAFTNNKKVTLQQILVRKPESLIDIVNPDIIITDYNDLLEADLYLIAVSDSAIAEVSEQLPFADKLVASFGYKQ